MNSLFSDQTIEKIKTVRKTFLWTAVFVLIGEVVLGAMVILTQDFNLFIGKMAATFALCAIVFFVGVNNFSRMIKGGRIVQSFALTSLIANIIWLVLAIMFIWEMIPFLDNGIYYGNMSPLAKVMLASANIATMCFWISNVWSIKETVAPVRPLKITATICELYCGVYGAVMTFGGATVAHDSRWYALAGLMGFGFIVTACAAAIVSNSGKKNDEEKGDGQVGDVANDAAVQAKIQEMVEKEVQARMFAQQQSAVKPESQMTTEPQNVVKPEPQASAGGQDAIKTEPQMTTESQNVVKPESQTSTGSDSTTFGDITSGQGAGSGSSN